MSPLRRALLTGVLTAIGALSISAVPERVAATTLSKALVQLAKRVLVQYEESKDDQPGLTRTDRSLREAYKAELKSVEIHSASLGLSRAKAASYDSVAAEFLRSKN